MKALTFCEEGDYRLIAYEGWSPQITNPLNGLFRIHPHEAIPNGMNEIGAIRHNSVYDKDDKLLPEYWGVPRRESGKFRVSFDFEIIPSGTSKLTKIEGKVLAVSKYDAEAILRAEFRGLLFSSIKIIRCI